jgi:uncharacterized membrane protein YfcA
MHVNPSVNAATSAVLVFYTSSMASLTYALAGRLHADYAVLVIIMSLVSGVVGVFFIRYLVKKYNRLSMITLAMSIVLGLAALGILIFGIMSTVNKAERGLLSANAHDLCEH